MINSKATGHLHNRFQPNQPVFGGKIDKLIKEIRQRITGSSITLAFYNPKQLLCEEQVKEIADLIK